MKMAKKVINGAMISICHFKIRMQEEHSKEILNMVKVNKLTIKLSIKLETGRIVHFKIK
jgi:hypothetical protein